MTDNERAQVLKMIEEGKISPEEGLHLMRTLEQNPPEDEKKAAAGPAVEGSAQPAATSGLEADPRIARVKSTAQRLWQIPLWIGVCVIILSAVGMYAILQGPGTNFWFYCLSLPLLLGVVLMVAAVGSRRARWLFVNIEQKPDERPQRIFLGFPLPLKFTAWVLRSFGHMIPDLQKTNVDEIIQVVEAGISGEEPLVVSVDEGEDGEKVQVYIG